MLLTLAIGLAWESKFEFIYLHELEVLMKLLHSEYPGLSLDYPLALGYTGAKLYLACISFLISLATSMEGRWVGTWRPHPRRGPILAEFSTPGPKYWIPGSTGKPTSSGGHMAHDPTKDRAPAYSFRGTKAPSTETCSPGPRYFIHPSITKSGNTKPSAHVLNGIQIAPDRKQAGLNTTSSLACIPSFTSFLLVSFSVPGDYTTDPANKHVYYKAPANSLAFRPKDIKGSRTPGPGAYTLPRVLGPHTAYTHAEPCYSMKGKSQYQSCFHDLAMTPGPAAFAKVDMDFYKTRAPKYTMGLKIKMAGKDRIPGPADYKMGKVSLIKARDPAYTFGVRHSVYKASLIPETHLD
ncbi:Outer dense fiber protein 3 [Lonchura striata]|uniref:Outer dense fiber protein 3 n=1 Tax=Lonchura striata TaxID=40157 RepID=A0A218V7W0_9PASE|nr:Outer dense fiber protein 3 [Lonchura striata domestica]